MVKTKLKKLLPLMLGSWFLFVATNLGVTVLTSNATAIRPMINTVAFALVLYVWSAFNVLRNRRHAVGLMEFVIIVYAFGFVSSLVTAVSNLGQATGLLSLIIVGSLVGIGVNLLWFKTCSQLSKVTVKSTH